MTCLPIVTVLVCERSVVRVDCKKDYPRPQPWILCGVPPERKLSSHGCWGHLALEGTHCINSNSWSASAKPGWFPRFPFHMHPSPILQSWRVSILVLIFPGGFLSPLEAQHRGQPLAFIPFFGANNNPIRRHAWSQPGSSFLKWTREALEGTNDSLWSIQLVSAQEETLSPFIPHLLSLS